jgi:hypothetical protein
MWIVVLEYQYLDNLFDSKIPRLNHLLDSAQATGKFLAVSNQSQYGTTTILKIFDIPLPKGEGILSSQGFRRIYLQESILTVCPTAASPLIRTT